MDPTHLIAASNGADAFAISRRAALRGLGGLALGSGFVAVTASSCGHSSGQTDDDNLGFSGVILGEPLAKPTIAFTDTTDAPFDFPAQTRDQLTLLFFGYTSCPDVCPITTSIIASALKKLTGPASKTKVVFVGVDAARDTPERIREFLDRSDSSFIGLTAALPDIQTTLKQLLLPDVVIPTAESDGTYAVGHPGQVIVFSPDNRAHIMYQYGVTEAVWRADLPKLVTFDWPKTTR